MRAVKGILQNQNQKFFLMRSNVLRVVLVLLVCRKSYEFLVAVNDEPLLDIDQVNEHLYEHVAALNEAMVSSSALVQCPILKIDIGRMMPISDKCFFF